MANENRIPEIIRSSMENIRSMFDADNIIGDPITTEQGVTIIPVSKVSLGVAVSGFDYNGKSELPRPQNFGGGGGTGLTVTPAGFIVISKDGDVDFINVGMKIKADPIDQIADLVERAPDIVAKIKKLFTKEPSDEE